MGLRHRSGAGRWPTTLKWSRSARVERDRELPFRGSQSTLFAVAAILEGEPFINGAPQNTFVPGVVELAERKRAFIGDNLKSGQTKLSLSAEAQFKFREISKSSVDDDMVDANRLLYKPPFPGVKGKDAKGEHPTHIVIINYVPAVGDSKRAIDERCPEIFCGGKLGRRRNALGMCLKAYFGLEGSADLRSGIW